MRLPNIRFELTQQLYIGLALWVSLLLSLWLYWPGLSGPFILDDFPNLSALLNFDSTDWNRATEYYSQSNSGPLTRSISMLSFIFDGITHGNSIRDWKLTNTLIHLLTAVIIFWLTAALIPKPNEDINSTAWLFAFLTAAIWLVHPLHVSTVLYTVQRMTELSALFTITGLLSYVLGRRQLASGRKYGWYGIIICFLVCLPLASLSKENGLLLPVFVFLVELVFFKFAGSSSIKIKLITTHFLFLAIPFLIAIVYTITNFQQWILAGYEMREFTLYQRVLTECRILVYYIYQLIVPIQSNMGFYHDDFELSKSMIQPVTTLFSIIFILASLLTAFHLRYRYPIITFGILFYYIGHSMESSFFPLELMFEHRNYLPSFGIIIAVVGALHLLTEKPRHILIFAILITSILSFTTALRANTWSAADLMYPAMYRAHPNSPRLNIIFANGYASSGNFVESRRILEHLNVPGSEINYTYTYCLEINLINDDMLIQLNSKIPYVISNYAMSGLINIAKSKLEKNCEFSSELYLNVLNTALSKKFLRGLDKQKILIYKAHFLHDVGDLESAILALNIAHQTNTKSAMPLFLIVEWLLENKQITRATNAYREAIMAANKTNIDYSRITASIDKKISKLRQAY